MTERSEAANDPLPAISDDPADISTDAPADIAERTAPATRRPMRRRANKRRKQVTVAVAGLVLAIGAVGFAVWSVRSGTEKAPAFTTGLVEKGTLVVSVSASGNMVVTDEQQVQPSISGTVEDVKVKLGQTVKAGDVLYTISNDDLDSAITRARAGYRNALQSVERAKISKLQAESELDKLESLTGTRTASDDEHAIAERQVSAARQGVYSAEDSLEAAEDDLRNAKENAAERTVKAPMDGVITAMSVTVDRTVGSSSSSSSSSSSGSSSGGASGGTGSAGGSTSSSGSSSGTNGTITISNLASMVARVQVNEVDLPSVKVGQKASLTFDAIDGLTLTGKVVEVAFAGSSSSGVVTYDVDIRTDSLDARIKPNMSASAAITTQVRTDVLLAPNTAVKSDTNGSYIQVVGADGAAQRVDVVTGAANDSQTEITEGATEGQSVVTGSTGTATSSGAQQGAGGMMLGGGMGGGMRVAR